MKGVYEGKIEVLSFNFTKEEHKTHSHSLLLLNEKEWKRYFKQAQACILENTKLRDVLHLDRRGGRYNSYDMLLPIKAVCNMNV